MNAARVVRRTCVLFPPLPALVIEDVLESLVDDDFGYELGDVVEIGESSFDTSLVIKDTSSLVKERNESFLWRQRGEVPLIPAALFFRRDGYNWKDKTTYQ